VNAQSDFDMRDLSGRAVSDRYVLRRLLGSGGFGGVFLTEQRVLGRPVRQVACKVSRATGLTEETAGDLFGDILQLAGAMEEMTDGEAKRHLVHVYDGGIAPELEDRAFLVMEFVLGTTLADQFRSFGGGRVPYRLLLKWARQICVALRGLHSQNPPLLHRDLKPDNVLLGADGVIRLIDFGLAARMQAGGQVLGTVGTRHYMAPETASGASVPASDVYSLGLLMYEGLIGRYPYAHAVPPIDLPAALHDDWFQDQRRTSPPPRPAAIDGMIPRRLDDLVMSCLEARLVDRVRSADQVIAAIDDIERGAAPSPGEDELEQARQAQQRGDPSQAASIAGEGLRHKHLGPQTRYALLLQLATAHESLGAHAEAARRLADAYGEAGTIRATAEERCLLLTRIVEAFRAGGNVFQADRFALKREAECAGR
jgi:serine/threonine protein kinase